MSKKNSMGDLIMKMEQIRSNISVLSGRMACANIAASSDSSDVAIEEAVAILRKLQKELSEV